MTYAKDATRPFYHGTRADLQVGDLLAPGFASNYQEQKLSWIYFSGTLDAAIWGCELAKGDGPERIYVVEPTGAFEDDPNLTDKRFPGNPTKSYRSRAPAQSRRRGHGMGATPARTPQGDEGRPRADGSRRRYEDHRLGPPPG